MNVKIENSLNDLDEMANLMRIVDCTKGSNNSLIGLIKLIDLALPTNSFLKYGKGSNHIWVSYRNNRILLITKSKN